MAGSRAYLGVGTGHSVIFPEIVLAPGATLLLELPASDSQAASATKANSQNFDIFNMLVWVS